MGEEVILRSRVCWECSVRGDGLDGESEGEEVSRQPAFRELSSEHL